MKKTIFTAVFLSLLVLSPLSSYAQTVPATATTVDLEAVRAQIIALLTQEIASLQAQINDILAAQAKAQATPAPVVTQTAAPVTGGASTGATTSVQPITMKFKCAADKSSVKPMVIATGAKDAEIRFLDNTPNTSPLVNGGSQWGPALLPNGPDLIDFPLSTTSSYAYTAHVGEDTYENQPPYRNFHHWTYELKGVIDQSVCQ